ncbi:MULTISPECIES: ABC transporter substrate-binding protein [unclassified Cryobacterium]|uniref:ABC transporter substrate-binding protein n=1 Tax=unclassified Cryobacterium TaxID=2649013 RepID=UPI002AB587E6|nr:MULTISPECIES: extracellular solute-binding protein [Cryobacterium]MDY7526367.1 extracellular solute-binding protein [Cryobacterium sp. 10C2]MDY7557829.1 extracellular solute-binding protein [Cryobacterium sp. 10C3]MEB0004203.1 extracellular solute-binding protein [Cryobacterium sp. RTC2.1]MEB0203349.1 extracellular solute-binding protein [Cryobacterium sp. 5I3]MEB0287886.1 extracellular solute-binding protein [Cryobacterium sp. 10S3]
MHSTPTQPRRPGASASALRQHRAFSRFGALGVAVAVAVGVSACGPAIGNDSSSVTGTSNPNVLTAPTDKDATGEITIWDRSGDLFNVFDATIAKFNEKYPNVKVNHQAVDIDAKLQNTLISSTDVPDGVFLDDAKVPGFANDLWDLSDVLKPYVQDIAKQKVDVNSLNGGIYGIPFDLDPGLLFYNASVLEKDGIDPAGIKTYDDLLTAAKKVKAADPSSGPIHLEQSAFLGQLWLEMFASQQGTSMTDASGKLRLDSPEYKQILTWLDTVQKEKLGTRAEYLGPTDVQTLDSGQQVFYPWSIWFDFAPQQLLPKTSGNWRAMPLPSWTADGAHSGAMGGSSFVIPKAAKNPKAAALFYNFLMYDKNGYTAVYGPNSVYPKGLNTSVPSYKAAADPNTPLFGTIDAMGGQDLWKTAIEAGNQIPGGTPTPTWWASAVNYLGNNLQKMLDGQMTPDEVIQQSTDQIQTNLVDRNK